MRDANAEWKKKEHLLPRPLSRAPCSRLSLSVQFVLANNYLIFSFGACPGGILAKMLAFSLLEGRRIFAVGDSNAKMVSNCKWTEWSTI